MNFFIAGGGSNLFSLEKRYDLVELIKKYEDVNLRLEKGMNNQKFAVSNFDSNRPICSLT